MNSNLEIIDETAVVRGDASGANWRHFGAPTSSPDRDSSRSPYDIESGR
ncbi:MAG TPA: hypothetical protein VF344_00675 [Candidatus Limnocylindrales bacterium]